jgi:hypothetical protein
MQKNYTISCCGECPAFVKKGNKNLCKKKEFTFDQDTSNAVDLTLVGFPEWCPLPDVELVGDSLGMELKRITRQILKRLDWDFDDDTVTSISHYLSTVVEVKDFKREKEKAEGNDLFGLSAS